MNEMGKYVKGWEGMGYKCDGKICERMGMNERKGCEGIGKE